MRGNCLLQETALICPMEYPKRLRNGPYGATKYLCLHGFELVGIQSVHLPRSYLAFARIRGRCEWRLCPQTNAGICADLAAWRRLPVSARTPTVLIA